MRAFFVVNLLVLFAVGALPQTATAPAFEVASIKRSAMTAGSWFRFLPGGTTFRNKLG
jgi:hypothetical protein